MDQKALNNIIVKLEQEIKEMPLDEGITVVSAELAHILTLSIKQNQFKRERLHDFFEEMENRIMSATRPTEIVRQK